MRIARRFIAGKAGAVRRASPVGTTEAPRQHSVVPTSPPQKSIAAWKMALATSKHSRGGCATLLRRTVTGDLNCDGVVNALDIEPFLNLLFP